MAPAVLASSGRTLQLGRRAGRVKRTMAVILAGGEGERLSILSQERAKPAVPFGGKYRIIDFTLSNCVNSDIDDVVVLTQYNPRSLNDHIGLGPAVGPRPQPRRRQAAPAVHRPRPRRRVVPRHGRRGPAQHQRHRARRRATPIVLLAGDHIYKMDYQPFVAAHRRHRADVTIAVRRVPARRGVADGHPRARRGRPGHRVAGEAQAAQERPRLDGRLRLLEEGPAPLADRGPRRLRARTSSRPCSRPGARVFGYRYNGYWQDVGTIQSFWEANMALLEDDPELDLYDKDWVIHTRSEERAPAKVGPTAQVHREPHQPRLRHQRDGRQLGPVAGRAGRRRGRRARLDRHVRLGHPLGRRRRPGDPRQGGRRRARARSSATGPFDDRPNKQEPGRLNTGITVVGKRAVIPRGARIGRNVKVAADVRSTDFAGKVVRSGESVESSAAAQAARPRTAARSRSTPAAAEPRRGRPRPRAVAAGRGKQAPADRTGSTRRPGDLG